MVEAEHQLARAEPAEPVGQRAAPGATPAVVLQVAVLTSTDPPSAQYSTQVVVRVVVVKFMSVRVLATVGLLAPRLRAR